MSELTFKYVLKKSRMLDICASLTLEFEYSFVLDPAKLPKWWRANYLHFWYNTNSTAWILTDTWCSCIESKQLHTLLQSLAKYLRCKLSSNPNRTHLTTYWMKKVWITHCQRHESHSETDSISLCNIYYKFHIAVGNKRNKIKLKLKIFTIIDFQHLLISHDFKS